MSAEPSTPLTSESTDSDAWMEELLLAGVKAAVKPSLSSDPIQSRLIAEPPVPTWAADIPSAESMEMADEIGKRASNIDLPAANAEESHEDSPIPPANVEMNHPLVDELRGQSADEQNRFVDDVFLGTEEPIPEMLDDRAPETIDSTELLVSEESEPEIRESDKEFDPVAAEIAMALKLVEEEAVASELLNEAKEDEELPSEQHLNPPEAVIAESAIEADPAAADQNESLSQDAISSLLAKFDDEDDLPPTVSSPKEPVPKVSCPAGTPQPKINLAALKKKSGDEAPALAARLFGEADAGKSTDADRDYSRDEVASLDEKPKEWRMPAVLMGLDGVTDRLRKLHPMIPAAFGILGGFLLVNGILTAVLASLGWI